MKVTYLVFENGIGSNLRVASKEEWKRILEDNRALPRQERRFFVQDSIVDFDGVDTVYIEASKEEYDRWHAENQRVYRKRERAGEVEMLSFDISTQTTDDATLLDTMTDGINWEDAMIEEIRLKELREKLAAWRDWANELLDYYLDGMQMEATAILSEKYGVSQKTIRLRKRSLEEVLKKFLK